MSDAITDRALRIIAEQIEAVGFDLDKNARQTVSSIEERHDLMDRRKALVLLYRMHGGDAATFAPDREKALA